MTLQKFCDKYVDWLDSAELKMSLTISHISGFPHLEIEDRNSGFYSKYFTISDNASDRANSGFNKPIEYSLYCYMTKDDILNIPKGDFARLLEYRDCLKKMVKLLNEANIATEDYFNGNFIKCMQNAHKKVNRRLVIYNRELLK